MELVNLLAVSFAAGLVAQVINPRFQPLGIALTALLGILGTGLATIFGQAFGFYADGELAGFFGSTLGGLSVVALFQFIAPAPPRKSKTLLSSGKRSRPHPNIERAANDEATISSASAQNERE